jgi:hypothetical protein
VAVDRSALLEVMEALKAAESVIGASPRARRDSDGVAQRASAAHLVDDGG